MLDPRISDRRVVEVLRRIISNGVDYAAPTGTATRTTFDTTTVTTQQLAERVKALIDDLMIGT